MSCFTSFSKDLDRYQRDISRYQCETDCYTFGWTYCIGWATVVVALIGTIISTVGFFIKSEETGKYLGM